jgi:hypothetical protein
MQVYQWDIRAIVARLSDGSEGKREMNGRAGTVSIIFNLMLLGLALSVPVALALGRALYLLDGGA